MRHGNAYISVIVIVIQVVLFVLIPFIEMKNLRFYPKISGNFSVLRIVAQCPQNESCEKTFSCQNHAIF